MAAPDRRCGIEHPELIFLRGILIRAGSRKVDELRFIADYHGLVANAPADILREECVRAALLKALRSKERLDLTGAARAEDGVQEPRVEVPGRRLHRVGGVEHDASVELA